MRRGCLARSILAAGAAVLASGACAPPAAPPDARPLIRVATAGQLDFEDLPGSIGHAMLRAAGYRVEETFYATSDLSVDALSRGHADVSSGAMTTAWAAAVRGAPVRTVMEHVRAQLLLVATRDVEGCAGLDGRRLALQGEVGASTALARAFLAEECPAARPIVLQIPDSANRAAALLSRVADAAVLQLEGYDWLAEQAPGRFHVIGNFPERWPSLRTTGVHVNAHFAARHPDRVMAYVRARLDANREVRADPAQLAAEAARVLGPSPRWPRLAQLHAAAGAWSATGGLSEDDVIRSVEFFGAGRLAGTPVEVLADLRFLQAALAGGGR
jgi:ABC-type nitrate/sulfonate/bicarbonate transport system substrate-binding protein